MKIQDTVPLSGIKTFHVGVALLFTTVMLITTVSATLAAQTFTSVRTSADYDAVKDFSLASNPNGVWSYGWVSSLGAPLNLYTFGDYSCPPPNVPLWHFQQDCGLQAYIGHNDTDQLICYDTWCLPPRYLQAHPGANRELTVVRWTAPSAGTFLIQGAFVGLDCTPVRADVHVLLNSTTLLHSGPLTSCKLPLKFQQTLTLSAGDTIDLLLGSGPDHNSTYDTSGIQFRVTAVGN